MGRILGQALKKSLSEDLILEFEEEGKVRRVKFDFKIPDVHVTYIPEPTSFYPIALIHFGVAR